MPLNQHYFQVYSGLSVHSIEVDFEPFKIAFRET